MTTNPKCTNMNHGKSNVSIRHCTDCGKTLNPAISESCNEALHAIRRKNRNVFCRDCGTKLISPQNLKR